MQAKRAASRFYQQSKPLSCRSFCTLPRTFSSQAGLPWRNNDRCGVTRTTFNAKPLRHARYVGGFDKKDKTKEEEELGDLLEGIPDDRELTPQEVARIHTESGINSPTKTKGQGI